MTVYGVPKPVAPPPKERRFGSSLPRPTTPTLGRNAARQAKEFARCYESEARVQWIRSLGCVFCGKRPSENAHVRGGGAGRKAASRFIVPACHVHHRAMHREGVASLESSFSIDLEATADRIEQEWQRTRKPNGPGAAA